MILAIRHYPDRKRPCIVLEERNRAIILGYLTDARREKWLREAFNMENSKFPWAIECPTEFELFDDILRDVDLRG